MVRGLYSAASGAIVAQASTDVIANNLANVNTGGFKRALLQVESNENLQIFRVQTDPGKAPGMRLNGVGVADYVGSLGTGSHIYDTPSIFEQGAMRTTGNALDLGINGAGFFTIQTTQGVRYTRNGEFVRNNQGQLATQNGDLVLGQGGGPIAIPDGKISISSTGQISVLTDRNGAAAPASLPVDTLRITEFGNLVALRPEGNNRFADTGAGQAKAATQSTVTQGALEQSNADVVRSMVNLIVAQRWFDANEKMIKSQDTMTQEAVSQVGHNQ